MRKTTLIVAAAVGGMLLIATIVSVVYTFAKRGTGSTKETTSEMHAPVSCEVEFRRYLVLQGYTEPVLSDVVDAPRRAGLECGDPAAFRLVKAQETMFSGSAREDDPAAREIRVRLETAWAQRKVP